MEEEHYYSVLNNYWNKIRLEKDAEKRKKYFEDNFDMVDLDGGSWTIQVPMRKK